MFCTLSFCCLGAAFSARARRHHKHLETGLAHRNPSTNHHSRYPLYMMQLYRSFSAADSIASLAVNTFTESRDDSSDSVLSLVAKG